VDITEIGRRRISSILDLFREARGESVTRYVEGRIGRRRVRRYPYRELDAAPSPNRPHIILPIAPPEVWGSGVTYLVSRDAREFETKAHGIYAMVYQSERPELFLKATRWRCVGPYQPIGIRSDSRWTVPEPELCFIVGFKEDIIGYTGGNDVSARDIEGENPLYLPQAKIYRGSCSLGPAVATADEVGEPTNIRIEMNIIRAGNTVYRGETNTSRMRRRVSELLEYLKRDNPLQPGTVCMTGTGIVPPDDFALRGGDIVKITFDGIGTLVNPVIQL
ncbi:MAG: fumarylacetoacetate hydrolase family protein, partial [Nitrososphaerota archaeon]